MRKIFATTQGKFLLLLDNIVKDIPNIEAFIITSDSREYFKNKHKLNSLEKNYNKIVFEWEIFQSNISNLEKKRVNDFEKTELKGSLYKSIIADRRFLYGKKCKSKQHYSPRFSIDETEERLVKMAAVILKEFDNNPPDLCLSFGITTIQDYLVYKIAQIRKIKFKQLRSLKIENLVCAFESLEGIKFDKVSYIKPIFKSKAKDFINRKINDNNLIYEGSIKKTHIMPYRSLISFLKGVRADFEKFFNSIYRTDNHVEWLSIHNFRNEFLNKLVWSYQRRKFFNFRFQNKDEKLFLYPLHFEPEFSIQFYGVPYLNQIELIRNIAASLPIRSKLVVKEHPRSYGVRKSSFYNKLLKIHRVKLLQTEIRMSTAIKNTMGVFTISGSAGLDAAINKKPCWVFGDTYYSKFDSKMICHVKEISKLDEEVASLLENFKYNKQSLVNNLAYLIGNSVNFDLYTGFLKKSGRHGSSNDFKNYKALADILIK